MGDSLSANGNFFLSGPVWCYLPFFVYWNYPTHLRMKKRVIIIYQLTEGTYTHSVTPWIISNMICSSFLSLETTSQLLHSDLKWSPKWRSPTSKRSRYFFWVQTVRSRLEEPRLFGTWNTNPSKSRQITIIPKPELRGQYSLTKRPFGVESPRQSSHSLWSFSKISLLRGSLTPALRRPKVDPNEW